MRGAEQLTAMRRRGYRPPKGVVVCLSSQRLGKAFADGVEALGAASIDIGSDEKLDRLDFRCLLGLKVVVHGDDEPRVTEAAERIQKAGAAAVVGLRYCQDPEGLAEKWLYAHNAWTVPEASWLK
jgi:hypothetical protein